MSEREEWPKEGEGNFSRWNRTIAYEKKVLTEVRGENLSLGEGKWKHTGEFIRVFNTRRSPMSELTHIKSNLLIVSHLFGRGDAAGKGGEV